MVAVFVVAALVNVYISTGAHAQRTRSVTFGWDGVGTDIQGNPETICWYCLVVIDRFGQIVPNANDPSDTECTARVPGTGTPGGDAGQTFSVTVDLPEDGAPYTAFVIAIDCSNNYSDPSESVTVTFNDCSVPGDVNGDGQVDISDAIAILSYLFMGGSLRCPNNADINGDGTVDISDPVKLLGKLFGIGGGGSVPDNSKPTNVRILSIK